MKFKIWLEKELQMVTSGISLLPEGRLALSVYDPQKRAEKIYGYFLRELPLLVAPWSSSELHTPDNTNLYIGDIVTDNGGTLYVVVPDQYGSVKFLYSDVPAGNYVIGCPWDYVGDSVVLHGNIFENRDLITNQTLIDKAIDRLQNCKLEIK